MGELELAVGQGTAALHTGTLGTGQGDRNWHVWKELENRINKIERKKLLFKYAKTVLTYMFE